MISTRGRYALRVLVDLAKHVDEGYVPMKKVAERQGLSLKYLEQILPILTKNELVYGVHGKNGGYKINRNPSEIIVGDVLRLTEGTLAPVACLAEGAEPCEKEDKCATISLWRGLNDVVSKYLDSKTIADLMNPGDGVAGPYS